MSALLEQTLSGLDWHAILQALQQQKRSGLPLVLHRLSAPEIERAHDAIDELVALEDAGVIVSLGDILDIGPLATRASKGEVLGKEELRAAARCLKALDLLQRVLHKHADAAPTLAELGSAIRLDGAVVDDLDAAFDPTGELSTQRFPALAKLRSQITSLQAEVRGTLEALLRSKKLEDLLQDQFFTTRNERFVLPIKSHAKRWDLGIVHGTSGSGATAYIEPHEVIALNNRIKVAEGELDAEVRRILTGLSRALGSVALEVRDALVASEELDRTCARAGLAGLLRSTRPYVGREGVVRLDQARHPVLALRGVDVVPNAFILAESKPALVLTGPNTGGKTVALKAIGLCALLVAHGCFVPAEEGSRVDLFDEVLASIGDQQTVHEDLSSFSAHLQTLGHMVRAAREHTLLLLDEVGSGTDPAQGAALATAVVEALVNAGARLVITTHFAQLKALGTVDRRFSVASMQYMDGHPTYVLVPDSTGESHAFATALRMGLPEALVDRAREHMGGVARRMTETLEELEELKAAVTSEQARAASLAQDLADAKREIEQQKARIAAGSERLKQEAAQAFRDRLSRAEKSVAAVVAQLQKSPSHAGVSAAQQALSTLSTLAPRPDRPQPGAAPARLEVGDRVRIRSLDRKGEVKEVSDEDALVQIGALSTRVSLTELERIGGPKPAPRVFLAPRSAPRQVVLEDAIRTPANTVDLRGLRFEEAEARLEQFLDKALISAHTVVFVLHGHGTGALKQAVRREWLPQSAWVRKFSPAHPDQGGDAYTIAQLQG